MSGGDSYDSRGLIPRTFEALFQEFKAREQVVEYSMFVSYLEIYNECGYDLLDSNHSESNFEKWNKI